MQTFAHELYSGKLFRWHDRQYVVNGSVPSTQEHYHIKTEEIYYITHGAGRIRIEGETRDVKIGDAIAIPPGRKHNLWNIGNETLRLLCCCAPAYEHSDTIITETMPWLR
jgi:mannose-6-phosphate isomerase-like protein (cupin superfamily)